MRDVFDDFLRLADRDFSRTRLVVFTGCSGSGKSTAIEFLLRHHRDFAGARTVSIDPSLDALEPPRHDVDVIVIDEIIAPSQLLRLARLLRGPARLLVASHLAPPWWLPSRAVVRTSLFITDADRAKIARHLGRARIPASPAAIDAYVRRFGANYTDLAIIRERAPAPTFDASLARFLHFCDLEHTP